MLSQFDNFSSWRRDELTIQPHEVATLDFIDTTPNVFTISNPNKAFLKVGIGSIPRSDSYEFKVEYNTTETLGRPFGSKKLYIYNDSSIEVKIGVFSIQKEFDPMILKNMNVTLDGYDIVVGTSIDSVAHGVTIPTEDKYSSDIRALLDLIEKNTSAIELNADTVNVTSKYDDTGVKALIQTLIDSGYDDASMKVLVDSILSKVTTQNSYTSAIADLIEAIHIVESYNDVKLNEHYENNAISFTYTARSKYEVVHFPWLLNDAKMIHVNLNGTAILTVFENERLTDLSFTLRRGDTLSITGAEPMFRLKWWVHDCAECPWEDVPPIED